MRHRDRGTRHSLSVGVGLLAMIGVGCAPVAAPTPARQESSVEVPDGTPQQLLGVAEEAVAKSLSLARDGSSASQRIASAGRLRQQLQIGLKAVDKLLAHQDADDDQIQSARRAKLTLLFVGVQRRLIPEQRLGRFVEEVVRQAPESEEAALSAATWLELRHFSGRTPKEEVLPLLADYGESYPKSTAGIQLFDKYASYLESEGERAAAIECYRVALASYGEHPEAQLLSRRLEELRRREAASSARAAASRLAAEAKLADLRRRLGNFSDGYFVLYAEENVKPPRHGGFYFYRYEYEVVRGVKEAAFYVSSLPEKWSWEFIRRFPETEQGRRQAYELWKELLRKKRGKA